MVTTVLALAAGCAAPQRPEVSAAPTRAELPDLSASERVLPVSVGIDDRYASRAPRIVPEFKPVEPTPDERRIIGAPPEPPIDFLALYRPPRPGIDFHGTGALAGVGGAGGADAGMEPAAVAYASYFGLGGPTVRVDVASGLVAGRSPLTPWSAFGVGRRENIRTGVEFERHVAGKHDRVD
ncbi:MAG: hypothetical protein LC135_11935 [Phycisphaerae bacterium]|nr:hypothetical protein [Phycisphaerae bacterium]MCZ2400559.1 hypothetical protein [Phycisphaerae bacterium]